MKKLVLVFGLLSGLIVTALMAINVIACYNGQMMQVGTGSMIIGFLSMIIAFSLIFVAIKNYRDKQNGGYISFGKAFKIGLFIALIASTMYVVVWAIMYHFFIPDFMEIYSSQMLEQAAANSTPVELEAKKAEMAKYGELYKNPIFFTLITYTEILPVGIVVALISALILKRKRKEPAVAVG